MKDVIARPKHISKSEKPLKSTYPELTMADFKALVWPENCKFGIVSRVTKQFLHASDSESFIRTVYSNMTAPKAHHKIYGSSVDIQVVSK